MDVIPLATLAAIFVLLPLPLCIYLFVQRNKQQKRIEALEIEQTALKRQIRQIDTLQPAPPPLPKTATPGGIVFEEEAEEIEVPATLSQPAARSTRLDEKSEGEEEEEGSEESNETHPALNPLAFLRNNGLWPPEDLARKEAGLIQWWAPRLGGLLAVLTVIFASVHISRGSPPWIRFSGLVFFDALAIGAGTFFLGRQRKFGIVTLATGLSMLYLTCVAGYAAAPVRVIANPLLGIALQLAVVATIFLVSLKIRERGLALIALVFGFGSSIFSTLEGFTEAALISSLALYIAGILFNRGFRWAPLINLSAIGVYLPVLTLCGLKAFKPDYVIAPEAISVLIFLGVSVSLLPVSSIQIQNVAISKRLHTLNTTICLTSGYFYYKLFQIDLVTFYGWAALLFLAWAAAFARHGLKDYRFQLFFIKASGLAALWLVNTFVGDMRWFALSLEAVIISVIAARSRSVWQELVCFALWLTSVLIAIEANLIRSIDVWSLTWILLLCVPIFAAFFQSLLLKAYRPSKARNVAYALSACFNGLSSIIFLAITRAQDDQYPLYFGLYAIVLASLAALPFLSKFPAAIPSAIVLIFGNIFFWNSPDSLLSGSVLIVIGILAAFAAALKLSPRNRVINRLPELVFHAAWITSLYAYLQNHFQSTPWMALIGPILAIALTCLARRPLRALADAALVAVLLQIAIGISAETGTLIALLAIAFHVALLALPTLQPSLIRAYGITRKKNIWRWIAHWLVLVALFNLVDAAFEWRGQVLLFCLLAVAFYWLWRLHRSRVALVCQLVLHILAFMLIFKVWTPNADRYFSDLPWTSDFLLACGMTTLTCLGIAISLGKQAHRHATQSFRNKAAYLLVSASYMAFALGFSYAPLDLGVYFTPIMAGYCLALIVLGLALSLKPIRLIGIVGLALPIYRLFAYDIKETLYRIIAFAVLAVLLGLIGYLYSRFQSRIEGSN